MRKTYDGVYQAPVCRHKFRFKSANPYENENQNTHSPTRTRTGPSPENHRTNAPKSRLYETFSNHGDRVVSASGFASHASCLSAPQPGVGTGEGCRTSLATCLSVCLPGRCRSAGGGEMRRRPHTHRHKAIYADAIPTKPISIGRLGAALAPERMEGMPHATAGSLRLRQERADHTGSARTYAREYRLPKNQDVGSF